MADVKAEPSNKTATQVTDRNIVEPLIHNLQTPPIIKYGALDVQEQGPFSLNVNTSL
jgi:hypothetical protein